MFDLKHSVLATVLAAALSGCSMMPDYQRPQAPLAPVWPMQQGGEGGRVAAETTWQQVYPDARLQKLIGVALAHNRDLRIATARIEEARAQAALQGAAQWPEFNLSAGRTASSSPASTSFTGQEFKTSRYDVGLGLVSYELDFWGRVRSLNASARATYLATEAAQQTFTLSLVSEVARAYFAVLALGEASQMAHALLDGREAVQALVAQRHAAGLAGALEVLQAESASQAARADWSVLRQQHNAAVNLLAALLGQPFEEIGGLPPGRSLAEQDVAADFLAGAPGEVLLQRPDVRATEQRLIAANADIGAARAAFLPRITLAGSLGTASRELSGLFAAGSQSWNFQPALTLPLFSGRVSAATDLAQARKVVAVAEYEKTLQTAFREVADLLDARQRVAEQFAARQAAAHAQQQRFELLTARYRAGLLNRAEWLDAQRDALLARQGEVLARQAWLGTASQLYKALGGGLRTASQEQGG